MNNIVWINLGVINLDRAVNFYQHVLDRFLTTEEFKGAKFAVFFHQENDVADCLVPRDHFTPVSASTLIYLNVNGRMEAVISQVTQRGGQVLQAPHAIGPHGIRALILHNEGDHIALHSSTN